jgi:hypothetical protein
MITKRRTFLYLEGILLLPQIEMVSKELFHVSSLAYSKDQQ